MAVKLEISDGTPWYLSTDVWVVSDPNDVTESMPIAGFPCYMKAKVSNSGNTEVTNATVNFYWANPSIGFNRITANYIGRAYVSLNSGDVKDVLCLIPWVPTFLNEGHECILAEAFHASDPLPASPDFNVPTDRHVAQRNLSIVNAAKGMFHFNFEMHNNQRNQRKFNINITQVPFERVSKRFLHIEKNYDFNRKKEGKLKDYFFSDSICLEVDKKRKEDKHNNFNLSGFAKMQLALSGEIEGDFAFLTITQHENNLETGGLGILIKNF